MIRPPPRSPLFPYTTLFRSLAMASDALVTNQTTADHAKAIAAKMSRDEQRMVFLGKKLIANYGCMSCHAINGAENLSSDRKSTRLNSSHMSISYAVFCLKKK